MYLEKLEIQGFKSFANKNLLVFPGMLDKTKRGLTAIVGPNGSGKSNIADAIRWVLGEQSMKQLRGKKSEDVIFSGSSKLGRLSMSEVSLYLNNEDKQASVDYSQIVLTRRLYRDGNSEYLLNNSRVRLSDVQMFLAKSKFGQKTYSVIGQGMVEGFLNTSLAERKEFFDEATGVKQFQIKRDDSLNKLRASYENLIQVNMLLSEIEPRLKSLTRQVNKLQKREEIEEELKGLQLNYYGKIWHEINDKFNEFNKEFLELEKVKISKDKELDNLNRKLSQLETENRINEEFNKWQRDLSVLQNEKDGITRQLAKLEAQLEVKLEADGQFDLSWLNGKKGEIANEMGKIAEEINSTEKSIVRDKEKLDVLNGENSGLSEKINKINKELISRGSVLADSEIKELDNNLKALVVRLENIDGESDIEKIKAISKEIRGSLRGALKILSKSIGQDNMEEWQQDLITLTADKEKLAARINEYNYKISAQSERARILTHRKDSLSQELSGITNKLKQHESSFDSGQAGKEKKELAERLENVENKTKSIKEKISEFSKKEEEERAYFFQLQKKARELQDEINGFNNQLNGLKVNSTRYETKLEDLESEIRHNLGQLKGVKENRVQGHFDAEAAMEKISGLKRQLDLIGGIDPEIEKEYTETKERFDFLSGQVDDLTSAINSLEKIIKELDLTIKERFDKEFKLISVKFEEYFKILFNGGQAKVIKVLADEAGNAVGEKENLKEDSSPEAEKKEDVEIKRIKFLQKHNATGMAGVEIQATPPGKKIKNVSMLSGGERALTAIALICAIISASPSPFVVLDEVDAALDEANSERLAKILEDLSHKTQFIVISHNRATMRRANVLYGVTMQTDGVSKMISIKLDEAEKEVRG